MTPTNTDLIKNYNSCVKYFYKNTANLNQKSRHWSYFYKLNIDEESLKNFRYKNNLSFGLDDQTENFNFKIFSKIVNEISEEYVLKNLSNKNIGNCDKLINYKNYLIDYNKLIHIHWFNTIETEILKKNKIQTVCEIGGGFGSFSELLSGLFHRIFRLVDSVAALGILLQGLGSLRIHQTQFFGLIFHVLASDV